MRWKAETPTTNRFPLETGSRNERRLCAVYYNRTPGFEIIQGLLDRVMMLLKISYNEQRSGDEGYYLNDKCEGKGEREESQRFSFVFADSAFFPDRHAQIIVHGKNLGVIGVLHPNVIEQFGLKVPCSILELNVEPFV